MPRFGLVAALGAVTGGEGIFGPAEVILVPTRCESADEGVPLEKQLVSFHPTVLRAFTLCYPSNNLSAYWRKHET
jgi:hypothetical protein